MKFFRRTYLFLKEKYTLLTLKKYTTFAGTLVFFFIMSVVPLSFWLTLLIGKIPLQTEKLFNLGVFNSVKGVFLYVQKEAKNATSGVTVLLLVTSLYSSTNLFYQMRRSGEIIYHYKRHKKGFRLRIGAVALLFIVMAVMIVFLSLFALGSFLFSRYITGVWKNIADYALLFALAFGLALLLNAYICPYKTSIKNFLPGVLLTLVTWSVAVVGFSVYLHLTNMDKLYGALSVIIVFLLWLYVLMTCFIAGVIFNSERIVRERKQRNAKRRADYQARQNPSSAHRKMQKGA